MNWLIYTLFLSIFILDYLSIRLGIINRSVTWLPDILSILAVIIISIRITVGYGKDISPKCANFIILFLVNIILGVAINLVPAGPLIAGIRMYLKFLPFFILPFVYHFSAEEINKQLKLLLFLFAIQAPLALYQRLILYKGMLTGDVIQGTLIDSGILTVMLSWAIAILMSFYLSKKISLPVFSTLFILFFIPTTINETKASLVLLPLAVFLPIYFSSKEIKLNQLLPIFFMAVVAGAAFINVYDYFIRDRWGYGILDFLFQEDRLKNYLFHSSDHNPAELGAEIGKLDSYILAFKVLSNNFLSLLYGLGIGNVSESFISGLSGVYAEKYHAYKIGSTGLSMILWELGVVGIILYYYLFFISFKDSRYLTLNKDEVSPLIKGWSTVAILMMISVGYTNTIRESVPAYLFWYFSGYVISECFRYNRKIGK